MILKKPACLFLLVLNFSIFNHSLGQGNITDIKLSFSFNNTPLSDAFTSIEEASGLSFSYNPKRIPLDKMLNYEAWDRPLNLILREVLEPLGLDFIVLESQIILKKARKKETAEKITLSGYILDKNSGEALIGASIFVNEIQMGTITNPYGFFSLTLPPGSYRLTSSYLGYESVTESIDLTSSIQRNIRLVEQPPLLEGVVITASAEPSLSPGALGKTRLRPQEIEERPALFGENDLIKSLESVPGIKPHSDGSAFYYVRGGDRDQNLILIDDAPIYNPSHLFGLFSTIIPDAINDVNIYKGEMPASIGGRLSSVMDIRTKKGNDQNLQIWGGISPVSSKLGIEGPIKKDVSSFLLSGRFSQIGWVFKIDNEDFDQVNFNDITGKLNFKLNSNNSIFFSFYHGNDNFFVDNSGIEWTNTAGTFRWTHLFSDRLFLKSTLAASTYDYFLHQDRRTNTIWKSHISNFTLKSDLSYFLQPDSELTFGLALNGYNLNPGNFSTDQDVIPEIVSIRNSVELIGYANHAVTLAERWHLNYGLRLTSWSNVGDSFEFVFDENRQLIDTLFFDDNDSYSTYNNLEPRIAVSYSLADDTSLKFSYSRNVQNLHLITNSISPFTSLEVWLPSNINIEPQVSDQLGLGYFKNITEKGIALELEAFYKKLTNQIDYEAHAETLLNPLIENELRFGSGESYGIELIAKKNTGRLRGWTGYTYSRARRTFDEINQGRTFNAFFDRPHEFNLVLGYDLTLRWHVGANLTYFTGAPISSPIGFYRFNAQEVPIYDQKNNDRLPDYQRIDLSASFQLNRNSAARFKHHLSFSIYNFLGRKNPFFINYHKVDTGTETFDIPANLLERNRVPSQTFLFQVIPSVSYNFQWQ